MAVTATFQNAAVGFRSYLERLMSGGGTHKETTLELVWQQDATALLFVRDADRALSASDLELGTPAVGRLALAGGGFPARRLDVHAALAVTLKG